MKVLYLGVPPFPLTSIMEKNGCKVVECAEKIDVPFLEEHGVDFGVSYRCPYIIRKPVIDFLEGRIINLHISLLPWNRGADPNLWSFLEDTPKGVTIHYVDEGLDTGDIIAQKELKFEGSGETLTTTYNKLNDTIIALFQEQWPLIMRGEASRTKQVSGGTGHKAKDKEQYRHLLEREGWDTPIAQLIGKAAK